MGMGQGIEIIVTALPLYHIFALTANCLVFMALGGVNLLIGLSTNTRCAIERIELSLPDLKTL
jgi:hypothetical protein